MCSVDNLRLIAIKKNRSLSLKATIPPSARGTLSLSLSGERSTIGTDSPSSLLKSRFVQLDPRARSVKRARVERPRVASAATRSRFPAFAFIVTSSRTDVTIIHFSRSILLLFSFFCFESIGKIALHNMRFHALELIPARYIFRPAFETSIICVKYRNSLLGHNSF